ncbi:peroxidase 31-like [Herrania umbratica]|uniref:Peroxidase n=1 Tax=Herrania umbratica TaxID=108875 RepID=A0A6J1AYS0_9ROSI|nr:peroxidase 31-like [Herrania umbratica]
MAFPSFLFLIPLFLLLSIPCSESKLSTDYYKNSCPNLESIIRETVTNKQINNPTTAAATLRLFFHDCMVGGCDASVLISSNSFNKAERDADINLSLPGDAFDVIVRAKTAIELSCPGIVSCADILALATRNFINMVGGPLYTVRLGRKDSLLSKISSVEGNLPRANTTVDEIIRLFESKKFTVQEMVALNGAHTIGFSHCKEFAYRLYNYKKNTPTDPGYHPKYAAALKKVCENYTKDTAMSAFNDAMTPSKFDNMYYQNLLRGLGLLESDNALLKDPRTRPFVQLYATNQTAFFNDFARAMEKLSRYGIKTGRKGEVRRKCDAFNSIQT